MRQVVSQGELQGETTAGWRYHCYSRSFPIKVFPRTKRLISPPSLKVCSAPMECSQDTARPLPMHPAYRYSHKISRRSRWPHENTIRSVPLPPPCLSLLSYDFSQFNSQWHRTLTVHFIFLLGHFAWPQSPIASN